MVDLRVGLELMRATVTFSVHLTGHESYIRTFCRAQGAS